MKESRKKIVRTGCKVLFYIILCTCLFMLPVMKLFGCYDGEWKSTFVPLFFFLCMQLLWALGYFVAWLAVPGEKD